MAPWCNRVRDARFSVAGRTHHLRPNLPDGSALHGDVHARAWKTIHANATSLIASWDARDVDDFNFPSPLAFRLTLQLNGTRILSTLSARNVGTQSMPVGLGFHPFFKRPGAFRLAAGAVHRRAGPYPTAALTRRDTGEQRNWIDPDVTPLDHCFTDVHARRGAQLVVGQARVPLALSWRKNVSDVFVYAPLRHENTKAKFMCIEPMTMKPGAVANAPDRSLALRPGENRTLTMTLDYKTPSFPRKRESSQ
jgi:aldose 1-epimerase